MDALWTLIKSRRMCLRPVLLEFKGEALENACAQQGNVSGAPQSTGMTQSLRFPGEYSAVIEGIVWGLFEMGKQAHLFKISQTPGELAQKVVFEPEKKHAAVTMFELLLNSRVIKEGGDLLTGITVDLSTGKILVYSI